jgi:hypothetical protein
MGRGCILGSGLVVRTQKREAEAMLPPSFGIAPPGPLSKIPTARMTLPLSPPFLHIGLVFSAGGWILPIPVQHLAQNKL